MPKNYLKETISAVVIISFAILGFILASNYLLKGKSGVLPINQPSVEPSVNPGTIDDILKKQEVAKQEYLKYNKVDIYPAGLTTPQSLIAACEDKKKVQTICNQEIANITQIIKTSGQINKAYLYIRAAVSSQGTTTKLNPNEDSVWFYITKGFGSQITNKDVVAGHLLRNKAIFSHDVVATDGSVYTEMLFDMSQLPFTTLPYNEANPPTQVADALSVLNIADRHFVAGFVSTLNLGEILEMRIGYSGGSIVKIQQ